MFKNTTPDQSGKAAQIITDALFASTDGITHATARLIAAALHDGQGTALQRLAATGRFDPDELRREVAALSVGPAHEAWRLALLRYVESVRSRSHPWNRSASRRRETSDGASETC